MSANRQQAVIVRVAAFFVITTAAILVGYRMLKPSDELRIFHPKDLDARLVDPRCATRRASTASWTSRWWTSSVVPSH